MEAKIGYVHDETLGALVLGFLQFSHLLSQFLLEGHRSSSFAVLVSRVFGSKREVQVRNFVEQIDQLFSGSLFSSTIGRRQDTNVTILSLRASKEFLDKKIQLAT